VNGSRDVQVKGHLKTYAFNIRDAPSFERIADSGGSLI
jgi:hypothetical protein